MPDAPTATPAKPKRSVAEIQDALDAARAKLKALHSKVESDARRSAARTQEIEARIAFWKQTHPGMPFDPDESGFDVEPHKADAAIQQEFHQQHYVIARLEDELTAATHHSAKA